MTNESKHEIHDEKNSQCQSVNWTAAAEQISACLHPELPLTDETEENHLRKLVTPSQGKIDDAAYERLFTKLEAKELSLAAVYKFANACYRYWQDQWPTLNTLQNNQQNINLQAEKLGAVARGRTLFRSSGNYYWGKSLADVASPARHGLFFRCYPHFETGRTREGEGTKEIYQAESITDSATIAVCEAYTQAKRSQYLTDRLFLHSVTLHQQLQRYGHHDKLTVNLQLALLYCRSGPLVNGLSIHASGQAVFYGRQALSAIARHVFTQQQPALDMPLVTAAEQFRNVMDTALLEHAQQTLFAAQSKTLLARWPLCCQYQDPELEAIYQLSQQTHVLLLHAVSVPITAKQPLLDAWLAGFNYGESGEDDQVVRIAMQSAVSRACNPRENYPHTLATVHQWLLQMARQLKQHGETKRALALLHDYYQLLTPTGGNLKKRVKSATDQEKTPYSAILEIRDKALSELEQWLTSSSNRAEAKTISAHSIPASAFAARTEAIAIWHETLAKSLAANTKITDIYKSNTEFARNLLAGICREIEQQIGPAPCAYTLLGAGSFSRGEISPASDLDCALLVADASVKTVSEDKSGKIIVTFHPWFQCFLQLLQSKLASLPEGVLSIEKETVCWIEKGCWFDTPQGFIQQHLVSQQPDNRGSCQQPENFGAQWLKWIYSSDGRSQEEDPLLREYRKLLGEFFHTTIGTSPLPAYQHLAPWSLWHHVRSAVTSQQRALSFTPKSAQPDPTAPREKKPEVKESSTLSAAADFTVLNLKNLLQPITNSILCYGRFNNIPAHITATRDVLDHLTRCQFLPSTFITRLETALDQLHTWRLRQHWAWLHHTSELNENEVVLWPDNAAQQEEIQALPDGLRGFYLNEAETRQCRTFLTTVAEAIRLSAEGFKELATTASGAKETEEIKQVKQANASIPRPNSPLFNPLAAAVEWTLQQLIENSNLSQEQQTAHIIWLAQVMGPCAMDLPESTRYANYPTHVKQNSLLQRHWQVYWDIPKKHQRASYIKFDLATF